MNAICLPIVLGFLLLLACKALPEEHRLKGLYAWVCITILVVTALFGFFGGLWGAFTT